MIDAITTAQMKDFENYSDSHGVNYYELMKNAGNAAGKYIKKIMSEKGYKKIVFLVGNGNNGGDCFISAAYLASHGFEAFVFCVNGLPKTEIATKASKKAEKSGVVYLNALPKHCNVLCDGIFGTGFHGSLPEKIVSIFNETEADLKIAFDIPSGGNGTDGNADKNTFNADITLTFGFAKTGLYQYPLRSYCGKISVIPIGFPAETIQTAKRTFTITNSSIVKKILPKRDQNSNKGTFGKLLCITGSEYMPGACAMSAISAMKSGCGLVTIATAKETIPFLASRLYPPVWIPLETDNNGIIKFSEKNFKKISEAVSKSDAVLFGCGLGISYDTKILASWLIKNVKSKLIIDADGLNSIAGNTDILNQAKGDVIITPHPGEFSRLIDKSIPDVQSNRISLATDFVNQYPKCTLVLKGAGTIVINKNKSFINTNGNSGMAKGGSGDVLAGIIASLAAQGIDGIFAAAAGTWIHGESGDIAAEKHSVHAMSAEDIISSLEDTFKMLEK